MPQSGGKLVRKSRKGVGTVAELWLPVVDIETVAEPNRSAAAPFVAIVDRPLIVLGVDDDALVLMNTVLMLEDLGHETVQAQSASEALGILKSGFVPDAVLTNHAMPGMTGTELAAAISEFCSSIPVMLATGYAYIPGGADPNIPRLPKPFTQSRLAVALAQAIARTSVG